MFNLLGTDTFDGVTVVDLTRLLPGPFATMLFADLGARVIKVEPPGPGDYARWTPPSLVPGAAGYGAFFAALNRGKESVALDLKTEPGRRLLRELLVNADVLVESFRPGVLERLGFGPDALRALNARLVVCRISAFGQDGPLAARAGHDINFLARSGMLGLTGPTERPPAIPSVQVGDLAGGALYSAFAIAAALYRRERTSIGAVIDISMTEGVLSMLGPVVGTMAAAGEAPARGADTLTGGLPCYRVYETADGGHLAVGALEPKFWSKVCDALGHPEWAGDGLARGEEGVALAARVQDVIGSKTVAEWTAVFDGIDACTEGVRTLDQVVNDELFHARGVVRRTADEGIAVVPPTSRGVDGVEDRVVPLLGEHTEALARSLGWTAEDIRTATTSGAVAVSSRGGDEA